MSQSLLQHLRYIQIPQFVRAFRADEDIGSLEIPVEYLLIMQRLQPTSDIMHSLPNLRLLDPGPSLEVLVDNAHEVSTRGELHNDAEIPTEIIIESFFEFYYIVVGE